MENRIKFRMVAYTGAAGKADPSAPMGGNEDNFYVDDNLSDNIPCHFEVDKVIDLAEYGLIMAVADGMGGQNAGEVASGIAVKTVQDFFEPGALDEHAVETLETRKRYLEKLVIEADKRIKNEAKDNPEHEGMGSTIILAWIVGDKLTLTWCGDSRAYRYNPARGIQLLSEDHSYVQELVNQGVISYDDTFDHPQGNIITRSLGERGNKAQPETRQFNLYKDDIILLCSDGLSGVLRDRKTKDYNGEYYPGENIEDIIKENCATMEQCKDALWYAAEQADWYDNVTIVLCQILDGAPVLKSVLPDAVDEVEKKLETGETKYKHFWSRKVNLSFSMRSIAITIGILFFIGIVIVFSPSIIGIIRGEQNADSIVVGKDKVNVLQLPTDSFKLTNLRQNLLDTLQKGCSPFMSLQKIKNLEDEYFKEIVYTIKQFTDINDTSAVNGLCKYTSDFIRTTQKKVDQIGFIDKTAKENKTNKNIINALDSLRNQCISNNIDSVVFKNKINDILSQHNKNESESTSQATGNSFPSGNNSESENTVNSMIEESFTITGWDDFIKKVDNYIKRHKDTYDYCGVYVGNTLVFSDKKRTVNQELLHPTTSNGKATEFLIVFKPKR